MVSKHKSLESSSPKRRACSGWVGLGILVSDNSESGDNSWVSSAAETEEDGTPRSGYKDWPVCREALTPREGDSICGSARGEGSGVRHKGPSVGGKASVAVGRVCGGEGGSSKAPLILKTGESRMPPYVESHWGNPGRGMVALSAVSECGGEG